jgi:hypothetical protein
VLISTAGVLELEKRRPVDVLAALLADRDGPRLAQFFGAFGPAEAAAMAYMLASAAPGEVPPVGAAFVAFCFVFGWRAHAFGLQAFGLGWAAGNMLASAAPGEAPAVGVAAKHVAPRFKIRNRPRSKFETGPVQNSKPLSRAPLFVRWQRARRLIRPPSKAATSPPKPPRPLKTKQRVSDEALSALDNPNPPNNETHSNTPQ